MTLEELLPGDYAAGRMRSVGAALERLLVAAQRQGCLTVGVYEAAKLMNADPDSVVLCLLAADEADIALQIHFTLIQALCCANDIHILRASGLERLAAVLGEKPPDGGGGGGEPRDLHCLLVTTPHTDSWGSQGLAEVARFCQESRCRDQWVPYLALHAR
ncbi:PREDICTED: growth arrest and DNA damage-inducible protein GADD45 beta [Thamnophis sirtalis]|uniref:Growth arrest and DNA damage-inducible protein GADD45 beta n=1 Tax=Thamnophis sirtalis TaxID=35019 RepID=A0A6I9Y164_9SAUR|nr:PREDICTED: growth arrest and DNA damage-inducible protein GADD45 beta [Thamnophis sirtalis]